MLSEAAMGAIQRSLHLFEMWLISHSEDVQLPGIPSLWFKQASLDFSVEMFLYLKKKKKTSVS